MTSTGTARVVRATDSLDLPTILRVLGDPVRLEIVRLISDGERRTAGQIAEHLGIPASTCSYHLKQLLSAGVTECHTRGTARCPVLRREELDLRFPGLVDVIVRGRSE